MADLASVLAGLGGQGATLLKGTIGSIQGGTLTVTINGGSFAQVPYLRGAWVPEEGQQVYLLAQKDWGMFAVGSPVDSPPPADLPEQPVVSVEPSTMSNWQTSRAWPEGRWVDLTGTMIQSPDSTAVWFYNAADLATTPQDLGRLTMELAVESGEFIELALHRTAAPGGGNVIVPVPNEPSRSYRLTPETESTIDLPLHWGSLLRRNAATGIMARSTLHEARMFGYGGLTFTAV